MTWRTTDELLERVRRQAEAHGASLNEWVSTVLDAATDPDTAATPGDAVRERLARAGLLFTPEPSTTARPSATRLARARKAAGHGTPLADLVRDGRG